MNQNSHIKLEAVEIISAEDELRTKDEAGQDSPGPVEPSLVEAIPEWDPTDLHFMRQALTEAKKAEAWGEVPIGSVIVLDGQVIGRGHNLRERAQDPTAHAEIVAIRAAAARTGTWRLSDATLYVTLEPCPMCAGALVNSRVARVVCGAVDPKAGATESLYQIGSDPRLNHRFKLDSGILGPECGSLLSNFFGRVRAERKKAKKPRRPF